MIKDTGPANFGTYLAQRAAYGHLEPQLAAHDMINSKPSLTSSGGILAGGGRCWVRTNVG